MTIAELAGSIPAWMVGLAWLNLIAFGFVVPIVVLIRLALGGRKRR